MNATVCKIYLGIWQVPLPLLKDNSGKQCFTPEGCLDINTPEDAFRLLNDSYVL